ncbi:cohesin domain-containing protein [Patescibacteria group bacterium]|nr:cohesin domain-containing protein [Patescibacteria group bacterium]
MKKVLVIIGVLLVLAVIPITLFLVKQGQEVRTKATPATVLSFTPPSLSVSPGDSFDIFASINTGENLAMGVDLKISFNPSLIEAISMEDAGFFTSPQILMNNIDNQAGFISYSVGSFTGAQGSGNIIAISFKAKSPGTVSLAFAQGTAAAAIDEFDILERTIPASIIVLGQSGNNDYGFGGAGSSTSTPIPTLSPTSTPTLTPTPILTATLTPTPIVSGADDIPVSGISLPTILGLSAGFLFLLFAFVLI